MNDLKKRYIMPEAEIVYLANQDIITTSINEALGDDGTDNQEPWSMA